MQIKGKFHRLVAAGCIAGVAVLGLVAVPSITSGASSAPHVTGSLTFPEVQNDWTFVWPFLPGSQFTASNASFDSLQQRPLYLFGAGNETSVDYTYSLANKPTFSTVGGKTIATIDLKGWKWSNGETVNAQSALFWINLEKYADNPANYNYSSVWPYGGYSPGVGIPDQVVAATATGNTLKITFNEQVNNTWALDNALQVITPMPLSWDISHSGGAAGSGGCSGNTTYGSAAPYALSNTENTKCGAVYSYLDNLSGGNGTSTASKATYDTAFWKVSDGPWLLTNVVNESPTIGGVMPTFGVNTHYSGSNKAQVATLNFEYFDSQTAETTALETGGSLATGGVPATDTDPATIIALQGSSSDTEKAGANKDSNINSHYATQIASLWGFDYAYFNFTSGAPHSELIGQQYIRQAINLADNQGGIDTTAYNGYAVPDCNPLPPVADPYQNDESCSTNAGYAANLAQGKALLTSHGWTVPAHGSATCTSPGTGTGECGAGIARNEALNIGFDYVYSAGSSTNTQVSEMQSEWASIGITMQQDQFTTSTSLAATCFSGNPTYDVCWYGGWVYNPGVFVSGEQLLLTGAGSNENGFSNHNVDCAIENTITSVKPSSCSNYAFWTSTTTASGELKALHTYANLTGYQPSAGGLAPYVYVPDYLPPSEINRDLKWTGPAPTKALGSTNTFSNPVANFLPEFIKIS
jgi:peptide/nickel transport system substrate-binding protein